MNRLREQGQVLQARRAELGLSRVEAYKNFRVSLLFITDIEEGHLEGLPPPIYARGFIKTYCESLGLSAHPTLDAYEDALHRPVGPFSRLRIAHRAHRPAWFDDALMWAAVAGVVVLSWISYSIVVRPGAPGADAQVQAESIELPVDDPFAAP